MSVRKWDPFSNWILRESFRRQLIMGSLQLVQLPSGLIVWNSCKKVLILLFKEAYIFFENWNLFWVFEDLPSNRRAFRLLLQTLFFFHCEPVSHSAAPFFENPFRFYWELKHCLSLVTGTKEGSMLYTVFGQTISLKALSETQLGVNNMEVNFNVFSWSILTYFLE